MFSPENKKQRLVKIWGKIRNGTSQDFTLFLINWYCVYFRDDVGTVDFSNLDLTAGFKI